MRLKGQRLLLLAAVIALAGLLVGCGARPLLYRVTLDPALITPNGDGREDGARIAYRLSRPCELSIYLEDSQGARHYLRQKQSRPAGESYEVSFGGTIAGRMLPDGKYRVVVEANGSSGEVAREERSLAIQNADTKAPELQSFTVSPDKFSPNQDGVADRITVRFYLTKRARVKLYLENPEGRRYPIAIEQEREVGPQYYDYDGGVDRGISPPPNGEYIVVGEAVDKVGNLTLARVPLEISQGGIPKAELVRAEFWPRVVVLGETLYFSATVRNVGIVPLRTTDPLPGADYTSRQSYDSRGFYQQPGAFRLGIDFGLGVDSGATRLGLEYPYRWALSDKGYLEPGEEAVVTGTIQLLDAPLDFQASFWFGLLHEQVRKVSDRYNPSLITIGH